MPGDTLRNIVQCRIIISTPLGLEDVELMPTDGRYNFKLRAAWKLKAPRISSHPEEGACSTQQ
jgi:hypothetical protein